MAQHWSEGVGTLRFTSREYQQELIDIGCRDNLLACPPEQAANFIALKILQEMAHQIRLPNKMKSVFVTQPRKLKSLETELRHLTDLYIASLDSDNEECSSSEFLKSDERRSVIDDNQVLVVVSSVFDDVLSKGELDMSSVNLLVIDECHSIVFDKHLQNIMSMYAKIKAQGLNSDTFPRIIAFSYPLFNHNISFNENNLDNTVCKMQKDYDDFINNRAEFYNQWDCDDLKLESSNWDVDQSNVSNSSSPIKLHSSNSSCKNSPMRRQESDPQNEEQNARSHLEKNCKGTNETCNSLNHFVEPVVCDEEMDEDYKKMTDFNYWRMNHLIVDVPETKKKPERLSIYDKLEYQLEKLEDMLFCKADMAPDIVGLKKITGKPREVLLQCSDADADGYLCNQGKVLKHYMKRTVFNALVFLDDHRYDPLEIYGDDAFGDELRAIPNPVLEPRELLYQFLHVLDQAGPYAADKAAFILLMKIEKLKVKIPYERHFLLFCLVTSVLIQIRSAAELVFEKYPSEIEKIKKFTSTKVLRLLDIFKLFKPKVPPSDSTNSEKQSKTLNEADSQSQSNPEHRIRKDSNLTEDFTSNVVLDNDTIKVYVDSKNPSDISSSQNVNKHQVNSNVQQASHLIQQIDLCDFQSLESKLKQQCREHNNHTKSSSEIDDQTQTNKSTLHGCDSVVIETTTIVDDLIVGADVSVKATAELHEPAPGSIEIDTEDEPETPEHRNVVDDVCYTKGAFEALCQSNPVNKDKEGKSYCGEEKMVKNHENNSVITDDILSQSIATELNSNLNASVYSDLNNYKSTPKRRFNDPGRKGRKGEFRTHNWNDPDALCGLIFVDEPLMAKILYSLIYEYSRYEPELQFINAQFTVDKTADPQTEPKEAENEHKLQEEVLRRFRTHECNLLIGTSVLEDGMDLPKCNLVVRWDPPRGYRCYAQCRSRARAPRSMYALMTPEQPERLVTALAHYAHIEKMLVRKCRWSEPGPMEEVKASDFTLLIHPYRPHQQAVTLSQAVQLVNRYCAKLPSDTFTRLVPLWSIEEITYKGHVLYICSVRLPINSPLKNQIVGHPMPTKVLARRIAALQLCRALHLSGELDDNLLPIGKESFRALEPDWMNVVPASDNAYLNTDNPNEPRPGTTKRKQYYYKKIAKSLTGCRPTLGNSCLAYEIRAILAVPLPERHNTRGRKLHPPENYAQGFCILTNKPMHQIPVFPLFTRSGEVRIELVKMPTQIVMDRKRSRLIHRFMKYTFKEVLRVHNHLMLFNPGKGKKNNYYIVPTTKVANQDGTTNVDIDWDFLELIYKHCEINKKLLLSNDRQKIVETKDDLNEGNINDENQPSHTVMSSELQGGVAEAIQNDAPVLQVDLEDDINVDSNKSDDKTKENEIVLDELAINNVDHSLANEVDKHSGENSKISGEEQNSKESEMGKLAKESNVDDDDKLTCEDQKTSALSTCKDEKDNKKLVKLEDLGEDLLEDTWKGQENKISSVKWDELEENESNMKNTKKPEDDLVVEEEAEEMPNPYLAPGEVFQFEYEKYRDAVVTPWYRNQNQPQYFYVAEICRHLTPLSAFPSSVHPSFMHYYNTKYGVTVTQIKQPLLDVDHTSARLNLLTPRFVNRKGVALPTSSERTKRAKRELLEQKQILVPELCCTHPFRGALWRAAVTLPCVLYRINSLLLADEIRRSVAVRVSLGEACPSPSFSWPPLDFGWSLADVLKEKTDSIHQKDSSTEEEVNVNVVDTLPTAEKDQSAADGEEGENKVDCNDSSAKAEGDEETGKEKTANEIITEKEKSNGGEIFEVGTWSNEMASTMSPVGDDEDDVFSRLPGNVTMCPNNTDNGDWNALYPNKHDNVFSQSHHRKYSVADSDVSYTSSDMDVSGEETNSDDDDDIDDVAQKESEKGGIRIEFKSGNEAEAIEIPSSTEELDPESQDDVEARRLEEQQSMETFNQYFYVEEESDDMDMKKYIEDYEREIKANEEEIIKNGTLIKYTEPLSDIKLIDYSENIPFHTPKHNGYRHINKRIDYLVHSLRNNASKHMENIQQTSNKEISTFKEIEHIKTSSTLHNESQVHPMKMKEDLTYPFPHIYEKALSKDEIVKLFKDMFPYEKAPLDSDFESDREGESLLKGGVIDLEDLENSKRRILDEIKSSIPKEEWRKFNFFAMKDFHNDDTFETDYEDVRIKRIEQSVDQNELDVGNISPLPLDQSFSFDYQPDLKTHPGPSPSIILQALTMSNANDGINLERLETVGDSFLKYAITVYLYCSYPNIHEGKLSYLRSKQVSNLNLYRLGRRRHLGGRMVACKFEPHDNWLPPCHKVPAHLERALIHTHIPSSLWNVADMPSLDKMSREEVEKLVYERVMQQHLKPASNSGDDSIVDSNVASAMKVEPNTCSVHESANCKDDTTPCTCQEVKGANSSVNSINDGDNTLEEVPCFVPYNLITQHSIPDKSIADCVEALIGAYLIECGPRGALLFMAWLGVRVLPRQEIVLDHNHPFIKLMEEAQIKKKAQSEISKRNKESRKEKKNIKKQIKKKKKNEVKSELNELKEDVSERNKDKNEFVENKKDASKENSDLPKKEIGKKKSKRKHKTNHLNKEPKEINLNKNSEDSQVEEKGQKDVKETESTVKLNKKNKTRKRKGKQKNKIEDDIKVVPNNANANVADNIEVKSDNKNKATDKCESECRTQSVARAANNVCGLDANHCDDENFGNCSENSLESSDDDDEEDDSTNSCGDESDWSEIDSDVEDVWCREEREPGSLLPYKNKDGQWVQVIFGELESPPSPLLRYVPDPDGELMQMLSGYDELERTLKYRFKDRCYLLQAMTHASHTHNRLTDCYQRLEFLGDAVLDYLITRQLYEDPRRHSPGPLTDLRSALVNNTIFASLAVRHGMHKFFRHLSPGLNEVLTRFVKIQEENGHSISEEHYLIQEDECEQAEDVEVPKALGDLFESVAGAIFLDSGMSLGTVWRVYYALMHKEMELFSETVPKSPVRELLEMEPETTKFGKPEKLADGRRVRVTVEVLGVGAFKGVGRNFRIAKCTAAKCALRHLNLLRGKTGGVKSKK